jgi:hypothetical protein
MGRDSTSGARASTWAAFGDGAALSGAAPRYNAVRSRRQPALLLGEPPFPTKRCPDECIFKTLAKTGHCTLFQCEQLMY